LARPECPASKVHFGKTQPTVRINPDKNGQFNKNTSSDYHFCMKTTEAIRVKAIETKMFGLFKRFDHLPHTHTHLSCNEQFN